MDNPETPEGSSSLYIALSDQLEDGLVLRALCDGAEVIRITRSNGAIHATLSVQGRAYSLQAAQAKGSLVLYRTTARVALYADDALADEEWPQERIPQGQWTLDTAPGVPVAQFLNIAEPERPIATQTRVSPFYRPEGYNTGAAAAMPWVNEGVLRMFYLCERRSGMSKGGLGARVWALQESADMQTWTERPTAIDIDDLSEADLTGGCCVRCPDGNVRAHYVERQTNGSPARIRCAESADARRFVKRPDSEALNAPYIGTSARDPFVFCAPDGKWNRIVGALREDTLLGGALVWWQSDDGVEWRQMETPFLSPGTATAPASAEWFAWDGRYYLLYTDGDRSEYRVSDAPYGPWRRMGDGLLGRGLTNMRTFLWKGDRYAVGVLPGERKALVFAKLCKQPDGGLGLTLAETFLQKPAAENSLPDRRISAEQGFCAESILKSRARFRLRMRITDPQGQCGVFLRRKGEREPLAKFLWDDATQTVSLVTERARWQARAADSTHQPLALELLWQPGAMLAQFAGQLFAAPVPDKGRCEIETCAFTLWGKAAFTNAIVESPETTSQEA